MQVIREQVHSGSRNEVIRNGEALPETIRSIGNSSD